MHALQLLLIHRGEYHNQDANENNSYSKLISWPISSTFILHPIQTIHHERYPEHQTPTLILFQLAIKETSQIKLPDALFIVIDVYIILERTKHMTIL